MSSLPGVLRALYLKGDQEGLLILLPFLRSKDASGIREGRIGGFLVPLFPHEVIFSSHVL